MKMLLGEPPANIKAWIVEHYGSSTPVAPNGKALYKTSADGEWLQDDANISDGTFNGFANKGIAIEVIIPSKDASGNSVTSIGYSVFGECLKVTSVTIPDGVTSIEDAAFSDCGKLMSVTIPSSVTSIGSGAFINCIELTSVTIPDGVTSIREYAFYNCSRLTSVTIVATGKPGASAASVKQMMIDAGVPSNITWNMPA